MALTGEYVPSPFAQTREQVELYESSGGTRGTTLRGRPVVILTTVGASSGKLRKSALMRVEHEGSYAVIASMGGAPEHPSWYGNLRAHPLVDLQDGPTTRSYLAHVATGTERDEWWARAVEVWPDYDEYARRTTREIPVVVLTPVADPQST